MYKVRNAKCINRLSKRSLRSSRTRNIVAILAIMLTSILFTSLLSISGGVLDTIQEQTSRQVGTSSHAGFKYLTWEQYEKVAADPAIKDISYNIFIGFGENPEFSKMHTEIRYVEEKDAEWSFCMPTTGSLPQSEKEAAVSESILDALGVPHELGVKIHIEFTSRGQKYKDEFTLCGFWEQDLVSDSNNIYLSREYSEKVAPTWHDGDGYASSTADLDHISGCVNPSIWFSNSWDIEGKVDALKERCGFDNTVNDGINWAYAGSKMDVQSILLVVGLLFLIGVSGYLIIYNIFYISVAADIHFYGLLKTIGTTKRQLSKIVRRQAYLLCLIGIPAGLLAGYFIATWLMPIIMKTTSFEGDFKVSPNLWISLGSAIFTLITVWISCIRPCRLLAKISPVEAVKYTETSAKASTKTGKTKSPALKKTHRVNSFSMAWQNMKRGKKKTISVVFSLTLSLVLLQTTFTITKGYDIDKYVKEKAVSDIMLTNSNILTAIGDGEVDDITPEVMSDIDKIPGLTETGYVYMREYLHKVEDKVAERTKASLEKYGEDLPAVFIEQTNSYLEKNEILGHIYGVDGIAEDKMEIIEGQFDRKKFESGDYVIVTSFLDNGEGKYYNIGEEVTLDFGNGKSKTYKVLAIGDVPYALGPQHGHGVDIYFTLPASEFIKQTGETAAMSAALNLQKDKEQNAEAWAEAYCNTTHKELSYVSKSTIAEEFKNLTNTTLAVGGALSFILGLIGILNFINAMITSIQARRNELAVLQAVGMTGKQLREMLTGEGLCYILLTSAITLTIGNLIVYTLVKAYTMQMWMFTYHFIIWPQLAAIPVAIIFAWFISTLCYEKMCRSSIVERLRAAE